MRLNYFLLNVIIQFYLLIGYFDIPLCFYYFFQIFMCKLIRKNQHRQNQNLNQLNQIEMVIERENEIIYVIILFLFFESQKKKSHKYNE